MKSSKFPFFLAVLSTIIMVLYAQFVLGHFSKCFYIEGGVNAFGLTFGYDEIDVQLFFERRNIEELNCYKNLIMIWDNIFPVFYTLTNILWLRLLYNKRWLIYLFPFLQMMLDWMENWTQARIVGQYIESFTIKSELIALGSFLTSFKWIMAVIIYFLIFIGIVLIARSFNKKTRYTTLD